MKENMHPKDANGFDKEQQTANLEQHATNLTVNRTQNKWQREFENQIHNTHKDAQGKGRGRVYGHIKLMGACIARRSGTIPSYRFPMSNNKSQENKSHILENPTSKTIKYP